MKLVNTVIVSAILAMGLAGNATAAPQHTLSDKSAKKIVVIKAAPNRVSNKVVVIKAAPNRVSNKVVVKRVANKALSKKVAKRVVKRVIKKAATKVYRVRPGDTLNRIAARNRVSVDKLIRLNGLWGKKASNLKVGAVIRLS